jgi:hypothetical protein
MLIAPIPRLRVTRTSEQALVLLLTLYQLGEAESVTAVCQRSTLLKRCVSTFFVLN